MFTSLVSVMCAFFNLCGTSYAAPGSPDYWNRAAVIYAEVVNVEEYHRPNSSEGTGYSIVHLRPIAVLTGKFDAALTGEISAGAWISGPPATDIIGPISKGKKVIALLNLSEDNSKRGFEIPNVGLRELFPKNEKFNAYPCLFEVAGFDDPKVTETIENLRNAKKEPPGWKSGIPTQDAEKAVSDSLFAGLSAVARRWCLSILTQLFVVMLLDVLFAMLSKQCKGKA
jgi:hypothetical protein